MSNAANWAIAAILAFGLVCMIAYARGPEHHHGDDVGTHGTRVIVVAPSP